MIKDLLVCQFAVFVNGDESLIDGLAAFRTNDLQVRFPSAYIVCSDGAPGQGEFAGEAEERRNEDGGTPAEERLA